MQLAGGDGVWNTVAARNSPSWYLHPLAARQKRETHMELLRRWTPGFHPARVLKTDLFDEAYGEDGLLSEIFPSAGCRVGMDVAVLTVRAADARGRTDGVRFVAADVRRLPFVPEAFDFVFSNSTLDHFDSSAEFGAALAELSKALRPGGLLLVTVDNPENPLYWPLRWLSRLGSAPFPLGYTPSRARLASEIQACGLEVVEQGALIHNPRLVSTVIFLMLQRLAGRRGDSVVSWLLRLFALLEKMPTKRFTACFIAACARKPPGGI